VLVLAGIVGFFYSSDFGSPGDVKAVFGVFDVNGWLNTVHIVTGVLGLLAFSVRPEAARVYAIALGALYAGLAVWGLIAGSGEPLLGIVPANIGDNLFHATIGAAALYAGLLDARRAQSHA
jgi:predicted small integral membrane protein